MEYEKQLANLLFPDLAMTPQELESLYPERKLAADAKVTRIGPSPTGFIHLGNLYNAIIAERLAHQSNGKFFLRIEDTDNRREVEGAGCNQTKANKSKADYRLLWRMGNMQAFKPGRG